MWRNRRKKRAISAAFSLGLALLLVGKTLKGWTKITAPMQLAFTPRAESLLEKAMKRPRGSDRALVVVTTQPLDPHDNSTYHYWSMLFNLR
jgi:hypothetical protein